MLFSIIRAGVRKSLKFKQKSSLSIFITLLIAYLNVYDVWSMLYKYLDTVCSLELQCFSYKTHEPEIRPKIKSNLGTRLSLKHCRKMCFWKTMKKLSITKLT